MKPRDAERSKNFFALGLMSWMYTRPVDDDPARGSTRSSRRSHRSATPTSRPSRPATPSARPPSCSTTRTRSAGRAPPGTYTNITGNTALAWGLVAGHQLAKLPLFLGRYPITPASDILHELSKHKAFGVRTLQAEDEIAGDGSAIGAAFRRAPRRHHHQRPGMALKAEAMGLAVASSCRCW